MTRRLFASSLVVVFSLAASACLPGASKGTGGDTTGHVDSGLDDQSVSQTNVQQPDTTTVPDSSTTEIQAGDVGSVDTSTADALGSCESTMGPKMVRVPSLDGGSYCIDSTEVSEGQYFEFLAATQGGSDLSHQPSDCDATNPFQSEWFNACTAGGTRDYPYGEIRLATVCDVPGYFPDKQERVDVGSALACEGGFGGIFDMVGNVWEWIDSCVGTGQGRACMVLGGALNEPSTPRCDSGMSIFHGYPTIAYGIRCCK